MTPEDDIIIKLPPGYTMVRNDTVQKWSAKARSELAQMVEYGKKVRNEALEEAARVAQGEWDAMSNVLSPEYILRHNIAAAIRALKK